MEYFVTTNLIHDGKVYQRGDTISFSDSDSAAVRLLTIGVIQTHPIGEAQSPAPAPAPETQPAVAGKPMETGEPSIDGREGERTVDNATDITPGVAAGGMRALSPDVRADGAMAPVKGSEAPVEPSEDMKRDELESMAVAEGIDAKAAEDAPNKAALIDLILENRKAEPEAEKANNQAAEPEHDPSANL